MIDMPEKNDFYITLNLNIVEHLGKRLYSNVPAVLSELVANAWDADATEVKIEIDSDEIRIKDNGIGMSYSELNYHRLKPVG
jgi:HSP90 family molecular chaperone